MTADKRKQARRVWRAMSEIVLDGDRKLAVSRALGISFGRISLLRRLQDKRLTLRELASALGTEPPYITLMVDDLEELGLARRDPHPDDGRAKFVSLTAKGESAVRRAEDLLDEPPAAMLDMAPGDLDTFLRLVESLNRSSP